MPVAMCALPGTDVYREALSRRQTRQVSQHANMLFETKPQNLQLRFPPKGSGTCVQFKWVGVSCCFDGAGAWAQCMCVGEYSRTLIARQHASRPESKVDRPYANPSGLIVDQTRESTEELPAQMCVECPRASLVAVRLYVVGG